MACRSHDRSTLRPVHAGRGIEIQAVSGDNAPPATTYAEPTMETPPDRLSVTPGTRYHDEDALSRGVGIRFNGTERHNVEEYCVSEGWIRVAAGRSRDRKGNLMTIKLKGRVEPYFRDVGGQFSPEE